MPETNDLNLAKSNPFPGLRSFDYNEHHLFFGREKNIDQLLSKLENHHFVAVVGTSGSGKSSLIKAGLLPAINYGRLGDKSDEWFIVSMKPGNSPLENLVDALTKSGFFTKGSDATDLNYDQTLHLVSQSSLGLVQALRNYLSSTKRLLLLVDQFEEVFRFSDEDQEKTSATSIAFVNLIIDSIKQRDIPIYIVLTLRSDFLGDCARFEGLPEAINDGHYLVPRLTKEQNKMAITGPINYASGKIAPRLVLQVLNDLGDNPDQLPVLQHALMRAWDKWIAIADSGEPMDLQHYEAIGGIANALSNHADEAYYELITKEQKDLIALVFKALTVKEGANRGIRRPTSVKSLLQITAASFEELCAVLKPFRKQGRTFILPSEEVAISEQSIIDISHESLMRGWIRLSDWVEEETNSVEIYKRLCTGAILYQQGLAALWRDPELQVAIDWKHKNEPNEAWSKQYNTHFEAAISFLTKSEIERAEEIKSKRKRRTLVRAVVITFLIVVSLLTTWALVQSKIATDKTTVAEQKTTEALNQKQLAEKAKEMALAASQQAMSAKSFAELQSNIAGEQTKLAQEQKSKAELEAQRATQQQQEAERQQQEALKQKQLAELKGREALDQKQKADSSQSEATRLRLLSISQNIAFKSIQQKEDPQLAALLAYQAFKMSSENRGNMNDPQLYNALNSAAQKVDPTFKAIVIRESEDIEAIIATGKNLTALMSSGIVKSYSTSTYNSTSQTKLGGLTKGLNTSYLSDDGSYAAIGTDDNAVLYFDLRSPNKPHILIGHSGLIRAVAFCDDPTLIASGGRDSTVIIWKNYSLSKRIKFSARIKSLAFSVDKTKLFVGSEDGIVSQYILKAEEKQILSSTKNARVQCMQCSSNGKIIFAGNSNGTVQLLNNNGTLTRVLNESGSVDFISVDEKNDLLITATANKIIHVYHLSDLSQKPIEINCASSIASISQENGENLFVACADKTIRMYCLKTSGFEKTLSANIKRSFTADEWNNFIGPDVPMTK